MVFAKLPPLILHNLLADRPAPRGAGGGAGGGPPAKAKLLLLKYLLKKATTTPSPGITHILVPAKYLDCANGGTAAMVAVVTTVAAEKFQKFSKIFNFFFNLITSQCCSAGGNAFVAQLR